MVLIWYSVVSLILAFQFQTSRKPLPDNIYPDWFFSPPTGHGMFGVGYSDERSYVDSAIRSATREAAVNLVKAERDLVAGEEGMATFAVGKIPVGSTIKETYDEDEAGRLGKSLKVVDWFMRGRCATVLASTDSTATVAARRVDASRIPQPLWVNQIPDKPGYLYSVGLAPEYYYENNSWREAERRARTSLALAVYSKVKFLGKKVDASYYGEVHVEETNVTLLNAEIVARWKDVKNQVCYVLVKMPLEKK